MPTLWPPAIIPQSDMGYILAETYQASPARGVPKSVLNVLAFLAWDQGKKVGTCEVSIMTLVRRTGWERTAIMQAITDLETMGIIGVEKRIGQASKFSLLQPIPVRQADPSGRRTRPANEPPPVRQTNPHPSGKRTPPVRQTDPLQDKEQHGGQETTAATPPDGKDFGEWQAFVKNSNRPSTLPEWIARLRSIPDRYGNLKIAVIAQMIEQQFPQVGSVQYPLIGSTAKRIRASVLMKRIWTAAMAPPGLENCDDLMLYVGGKGWDRNKGHNQDKAPAPADDKALAEKMRKELEKSGGRRGQK